MAERCWQPTITDVQRISQGTSILRKEKITVVSYNLWCHSLSGGWNTRKRLEAFVNGIGDWDILVLQEMFTVKFFRFNIWGWKKWLIEQCQAKGFLFWADSDTSLALTQDSGLLVLSKLPIVEVECMRFSALGKFYNQKGALHVTIDWKCLSLKSPPLNIPAIDVIEQSNEECFHIINVHCAPNPDSAYQQLAEVSQTFPNLLENTHTLIAGDFNIPAFSEQYNNLLDKVFPQLRDCWEGKKELTCYNWKLDHMLASEALVWDPHSLKIVKLFVDDEEAIPVSDHLGISADFIL